MPRVNLLLALLWLPLVVGCEGCRRSNDPNAEEEQVPLEDFTARPALSFPSDGTPASGVKPGHWITASQALKSNKIDSRGQLVSRATASGVRGQDGTVETTTGGLPSMRPVVLPKGQMRRFDYRILTPIPSSSDQRRAFLQSRFVSTGRTVYEDNMGQPIGVLSGEEFFFVILTERPERFAKFQVSDWVRPFRDDFEFEDPRANFRIVLPPTKDVLPLAETMLDWTSTSVLLWDDLSPDALTPQQLTAIADWVRFGGQLIVNGAEASDAIAKTALADVLPLKPSGNIELDPDAAAELLQGWAVATDRSTDKQIALLRSQAGRVAVDGPVAADAKAIPDSGNLVWTRQVGGGRVVQPRFDVTSDWLINWQSYDSFINAVLLTRPRREFVESRDAETAGAIQQFYPDYRTSNADVAFNSRFRITARDAVLPSGDSGTQISSGAVSRYDPLILVDSISGISGWNDDSDVIGLSRQILRSESGIEIPKSSLVVRSLGCYLLILVPVNYLFFRLIGRLEYAWLAVPVIAIGGAIWVARAARLDIGFARSQTEIAFLEMQPGYARGHLSRVVAIYNSLSTTYDIEFKTIDAAAAPVRFGRADTSEDGTVFKTGFSEGPIMSGLPVMSNQVRMVHAEQIVDLGGSIELNESGQLVNRSSVEFSDALVVEKDVDGQTSIAVVGPFASGSVVKLQFRPIDQLTLPSDLPMQVGLMIQRLVAAESVPSGSMRMVARFDGTLEGMKITPDTYQSSAQTVLLAHLKHPAWPESKADANLISDLRPVLTDEDEDRSPRPDIEEAVIEEADPEEAEN